VVGAASWAGAQTSGAAHGIVALCRLRWNGWSAPGRPCGRSGFLEVVVGFYVPFRTMGK